MKSILEMSQAELAAFVQTYLEPAGVDVVLSGGASVAFYSAGQYVSLDIDLIERYFPNPKNMPDLMAELGFEHKGRYFIHPDSRYWIDFPPGPLSVGREPVKDVRTYKLETGILKIISPTDSVKDRLLAYFHWDDLQTLAQATMIASAQKIDWAELKRWGLNETSQEKLLAAISTIQKNRD